VTTPLPAAVSSTAPGEEAAFDAMAAADDADEALRAALTGAWTLISLLGFEPGTDHCIACERPLVPAEPVRFDTSAGGVACVRCRPAGRIVPAASRAELHAMVRGRTPDALASPGLHRALLRVFLETHVQQDRPFRALELFLDQFGAALPADGDGDDDDAEAAG